jgi:hypothetical protein
MEDTIKNKCEIVEWKKMIMKKSKKSMIKIKVLFSLGLIIIRRLEKKQIIRANSTPSWNVHGVAWRQWKECIHDKKKFHAIVNQSGLPKLT